MSRTITPNRAEELTVLTTTYRDAKESFERHRDRWHDAITAAVDDGMKPSDVGHLVGVSPQRIQAIVARVYSRSE